MNIKLITTLLMTALLATSAAAQAARTKTITLIELNDLHAHLVPHAEVVGDGNGGTRIESRGGQGFDFS